MQNNASLTATINRLQTRGISYQVTKVKITDGDGHPIKDINGNDMYRNAIVISNIPKEEADINRFFIDSEPCWFGGCEELREEYKSALRKADKTGNGCTGCEKGAIMRMLEEKVRQAIKSSNEHPTGNTRTEKVSGIDGESYEGAVSKPSMLRRATSYLKKIFSFSKK